MSHNENNRNKAKQTEPPTLADIVREKTNDVEVEVDDDLAVVRGKLDDDGFEVCHRLEAAEQLQAIAPGLVSEYIAQLTGVECSHVLLRKRTRDLDCIPREDRAPLPSRDSARARHQALEYLASALEAPSLREDPRVAGIVRGSTDHGKTVVSFLLHVMHGVVRGFRPRQRVDAASELLGHIARDELARSGSVTPSPAPAADESSFPSSREPIPGPSSAKADPTVIPAEAGIQQGGDGDDPDYPRTAAAPESSSRKGESSFPSRREPIPGPAKADPTVIPAEAGIQQGGDGDDPDYPRTAAAPESSSRKGESSFPSSREPIPGPAKADPTVIPAEAGIQQGGDGDDPDYPRTAAAPESSSRKGESSFPSSREPIPGPAKADPTVIPAEAGIQQGGDGDDPDDTDTQRGCYDIDRKITEAQRDPSHAIHKFVQAYDEVAATFHREDQENDNDDEVRYWISGEVVDLYGKYIWEYAPANPKGIRRKLRPRRRRRSREPGTAPKAESVWMKRPSDKMREEGIPPPKRTLMWI